MLHSESRRLYSWWWDSHISPKNSKWLQENLTDMDAKVKAMIKLIEEDADSFARRAEMYYKKRPELMKLVEEFYRAYRALAERYDHATGELRHAHKAMAEAFPNQVPFVLPDDSPSGSAQRADPHTPETSLPVRALFGSENGSYSGDSDAVVNKKGLKQLYELFGSREVAPDNVKLAEESGGSEVVQLSNENENLKKKILCESERAVKAESELEKLKKALIDVQAEKEAVLSQYQNNLEKLSNLEGELICAEKDSTRLKEQASKAESEFFALKEAIIKLEAERDVCFVKNKDCLERISNLEAVISRAQEDAKVLDERTIKAETESQYLKNELSRLESEKQSGLLQYKQCLEKISDLEKKVFVAEEDARRHTQQAERAESEVQRLKLALTEVTAQKEAATLQYNLCLEKVSKLEDELSHAQEEIRNLNSEILAGATELRTAEGRCDLLEMSNQTLRVEAENLVKKIALKDQELSKKHDELQKLQVSVQDERLHYDRVEATLSTLQNLYSQSQEEQRTLALELKNGIQMLKDMEICKHSLEHEIQQIKDENRSLNELNSSSALSLKDLQDEIIDLTRMKARLEEEVAVQLSRSNALQQEICRLKEEINGLNSSYLALIKQVELVGLNPKCFGTSVKELQDENSRLTEIYEKDRDEKQMLSKKLAYMEELIEKNAALQCSLSDINTELQGSQEKAKVLQESCRVVEGEKSSLVAEKSVLLSQLQIVTENMQKLLEKNTALENSLCGANLELEGLKERSRSLEELCQLLGNEKASLLAERSALAGQLQVVERRLENLEMRFKEFEEKYAGLEKEKETTHSQLEELRVCFGVEKQERESLVQWSESRIASLENDIRLLQEESSTRKKEFQDELDKAVISQFEIFVLQKFIEDIEEKNCSLLIESQKQMEASILGEELISELEKENLEQQVEAELLLVEIEKLRLGICQIFKALDIRSKSGSEEKIEKEQRFVHYILEDIQDMKHSLSNYTDDKHLLLVENSVLLTLLGELRLEGLEVESEKYNLDEALKTTTKELLMANREKHELVEMNGHLRSELSMENHQADKLMAEVESLNVKQACMESAIRELQAKYSQSLQENRTLLKSFLELKEEKGIVDEENNTILLEMLTFASLSTIFTSFMSEKATESKMLSDELHQLHGVNDELEKQVTILRDKLGLNETEKLHMKALVEKLEMELSEVKDLEFRLKQEISSQVNSLSVRESEVSDTKQNLFNAENLCSELCRTVEGLKRESEKSQSERENLEGQLLKLSEDNVNQKKEIQCLLEVNRKLETEIGKLNQENEERRIREENLNLELQESRNEFELWDSEASSFYFDLQLSSIREVLLEDKVHELAGVCETLQDETVSKAQAIEQMKERVSFSEDEVGGLKSKLLAYAPAIDSLRDNIESLEHSTLSKANLITADYEEPKNVGAKALAHEKLCQEPVEDQNSPIPDGVLDLQKLQDRIKAVEKVLMAEMNRAQPQECLGTKNIKLEAAVREIESLKSKCSSVQENDQKTTPEHPEVKNGIRMKDIPLDQVSDCSLYGRSRRGNSQADEQMLVLWETADNDQSIEIQKQDYGATEEHIVFNQLEDVDDRSFNPSSELDTGKELGVDKLQVSRSSSMPNRGGNKKKTLERLASDGQKLANIQTTVHDLRRKLETNRKSRNAKNVDLETVKEQLQEVEETAVQLFDLNVQMTRNIEEISVSSNGNGSVELHGDVSVQKKRISEEARKGSEKIGRLQLEVQKIQYVLLKLEDETNSQGKGRLSRTKSRTTIILRDFIHSGRRGSAELKKKRLCGCFKPSTSGEANNI